MVTLTNENFESFRVHLSQLFMGNADALALAMMMIKVADVWDDIIDGDSPSDDDVNKAFMVCLFELPRNPFYVAHQDTIRPVIESITLRWLDANQMESQGEHLEKCYMLRAGLYDLFAHIAFIVGGYDYYKQVGPVIRKMYGESLDDYLEEMQCQTP